MQVKRLNTDMFAWPEGTRHYRTAAGTYFAVDAQLPGENAIPAGVEPMLEEVVTLIGEGRKVETVVGRPTVVFECNEDGSAIDLTPLQRFPSGTTHEDALAQMGYEVT